jgi:histidine triad (HIT) family protein
MADCLFCKIAAKQIPSKVVFEDADCLAFEDLNPQAPTHVLVIPKRHLANCNDLTPADEALAGHLLAVAAQVARDRGHAAKGYRVVLNTNADAGQTVFHLHAHLLGGRAMGWPPG